jgi:hypothetical protein
LDGGCSRYVLAVGIICMSGCAGDSAYQKQKSDYYNIRGRYFPQEVDREAQNNLIPGIIQCIVY